MWRHSQLRAYEQATSSAEIAYGKSKALALQRLNSRNSQLLQGAGGGAPAPASHAASAPSVAAPPTPEQEDDRSTFPDDGERTHHAVIDPLCLLCLLNPARASRALHLLMPPAELYLYSGMGSRMGCRLPKAGMQGACAAVSWFPQGVRMSAASCIWCGAQGALRRPIVGGRRRS